MFHLDYVGEWEKVGSLKSESALRPLYQQSRFGIISCILESIQERPKTKLTDTCNLSFLQLNLYMKFLGRIGLLRERIDAFEITEKGRTFLEEYEKVKDSLSKTLS